MHDDPFFALRDRAYELADTGRYKHWPQVEFALQAEKFPADLIARIGKDKLAVMMINRCCDQARANA